MALFLKTNPVDLDKKIDAFQQYLFSMISITGMTNDTDWNCYERIYAIPNDKGLIPHRFVENSGRDYLKTFYDDRFSISSYFYASQKRPVESGDMISCEVSLVVQANILKLFPNIAHRADEEIKNIFSHWSRKYPLADDFKLTAIEEGINNVYSEFTKDVAKLYDTSEKHVFRLKYKVRYTPSCAVY